LTWRICLGPTSSSDRSSHCITKAIIDQTTRVNTCICLSQTFVSRVVKTTIKRLFLLCYYLLVLTRVGLKKCLNLSPLVVYFRFSAINRGKGREYLRCSTWEVPCLGCGIERKWTKGIFCVKYSRANAISQICRSVWCGKCNTLSNYLEFVVNGSIQDESNEEDQNSLELRWGNKHQSKN
jgi:hypothetical protein